MRNVLATLLATAALTHPLPAQGWPGRSARTIDHRVEVLDSASGMPRVVFRDRSASLLGSPAVAPGGGRIAVVVYHDTVPRPHTDEVSPASRVLVLDGRTGETVASYAGGVVATWCGSDCLAVSFGVLQDGPDDQQFAESLALIDLKADSIRAVIPRTASAMVRPFWNPREDRLEFAGLRGLRAIDLNTLHLTILEGEERTIGPASGSGRFTIQWIGAEEYVAQDGRRLAPPGEAGNQFWDVEGWLGRTDNVLLRPVGRAARALAPMVDYRIWDLTADTLSAPWRAIPTGWRGPAPNSCRLFLKEGKLTTAPGCR